MLLLTVFQLGHFFQLCIIYFCLHFLFYYCYYFMLNVKFAYSQKCLPISFLCLFSSPPSGRDRFRTMVNVMGDALATGIMAHICRKDFMKEGDGVSDRIADDAMAQK